MFPYMLPIVIIIVITAKLQLVSPYSDHQALVSEIRINKFLL